MIGIALQRMLHLNLFHLRELQSCCKLLYVCSLHRPASRQYLSWHWEHQSTNFLPLISCCMSSRWPTWKITNPCCNPALHCLSSVLISPWWKKLLTLLPFCWASTNVWILWRVLITVVSLSNRVFRYRTSNILCEFSNMIQHTWWQFSTSFWLDMNHQDCI